EDDRVTVHTGRQTGGVETERQRGRRRATRDTEGEPGRAVCALSGPDHRALTVARDGKCASGLRRAAGGGGIDHLAWCDDERRRQRGVHELVSAGCERRGQQDCEEPRYPDRGRTPERVQGVPIGAHGSNARAPAMPRAGPCNATTYRVCPWGAGRWRV